MLLETNEIWLWYCTNIKLLNFVASQAIAEITNSFENRRLLGFFLTTVSVSVNGLWKAWWNQFCESPPPTRHTELSLWTAAARGFSNTQRLLSKSHNRNKNKPEPRTTADPHGHNIQNTLSGPIRLHSTRSISLADHGTGTEER